MVLQLFRSDFFSQIGCEEVFGDQISAFRYRKQIKAFSRMPSRSHRSVGKFDWLGAPKLAKILALILFFFYINERIGSRAMDHHIGCSQTSDTVRDWDLIISPAMLNGWLRDNKAYIRECTLTKYS